MKVRIQNDGDAGHMTRITDAETGESLNDLMVTKIVIDAHEQVPRAILTCILPPIDIVAEAEVKHVCPHCRHVIAVKEES